MKVSVIVPVYNVERYIDRCISSILAQTFQDFELIIINDGSTDNSGNICREWMNKDSRITLIDQTNSGVSTARNRGIKASCGEYIAFVDGDDYLEKSFLAIMVECASENANSQIIMCGYKYDDEGSIGDYSFFEGDNKFRSEDRSLLICRAIGVYEKNIRRKTHIGVPWAKLYKASFLKENSFCFDIQMPRMQDLIFNIACFKKVTDVVYIDQHLYVYVKRGDSTVNGYRPDYEKEAGQIIDKLTQVTDDCKDAYIREAVNYKAILLLIECIRLQYAMKECPLNWREKKRNIRRICSHNPYKRAVEFQYNNIRNSLGRNVFLYAIRRRLFLLAYLLVLQKYKRT